MAWPSSAVAGHGDAPAVFTQPVTIASATVTEEQCLTAVVRLQNVVRPSCVTEERKPGLVATLGGG